MYSAEAPVWAVNGLNPGEEAVNPNGGSNFPRNAAGTSFGNADPSCEAADALDA